jgi:hypothetical protein
MQQETKKTLRWAREVRVLRYPFLQQNPNDTSDDQTRNCIETLRPLHHTSTSHPAHAIYLFLTLTIFFLSVNSNRHLKEAQDIILASACNRRRLSWLCSFYRTPKALIGVSSLWSCPSPLYPLLNALHIPQLVIILRVIRVR